MRCRNDGRVSRLDCLTVTFYFFLDVLAVALPIRTVGNKASVRGRCERYANC